MKSTNKFSPIKYRQVLETIEKIAMINNQNEDNAVLNDIYCIAHAFVGKCKNLHFDWKELQEKIDNNLKTF
ncbi:MAG: hypothetical protein AABY15_03750 [Nanoarchaeota archaeon]